MSKHSEVACLSKASIFKNLPLSLKKKLVTITSHQDFFPKGSLIRQPLDGQDGMIVIDSGHAKVYSLNEDGKETVLGVLAKGDSTGQENLFSQKDHENFIQATEDCLVFHEPAGFSKDAKRNARPFFDTLKRLWSTANNGRKEHHSPQHYECSGSGP